MTLSHDRLTETVLAITRGELGADVNADTDLRTVEGADSVKLLRVVAKIEREYNVELEDEDVFSVTSVTEVVAVLERTLVLQDAP